MLAFKNSIFVIVLVSVTSTFLMAQQPFDEAIKQKMDLITKEKVLFTAIDYPLLPSNTLQNLSTPSGWSGGRRSYLFFVVGGVFPALYTTPSRPDLITSFGGSFGDPNKRLNVSASINVARVSEIRDLSANLVLSKRVGKASSISVGALQVLANRAISDAPDETFYVAFSHAIQTVKSKIYGYSALGYTIGFGTGRFLYKSPLDIASGKGKYGTGLFANISYEIVPQLNVNAEWSGLNLGCSLGVKPFSKAGVTIGMGAYNLTGYSGDRVMYMAVLGIPFFLKKYKPY